jgi:tetratricopeptide (TPR) repeat protein
LKRFQLFRSRSPELAAAAGLLLLVMLVFLPVVHFPFLGIDDDVYVENNPHVQQGLTLASLHWALTSFDDIIWMPVTRMSYLLDRTIWGPAPGGFHLTSLFLHAAGVLLVYFLLRRLTGSFWRSLLVAALCAVHPLRVEPVAWIADRKDLLGFVCVLLSIGAYARWTRARARGWYLASLGLFLLAVGSKTSTVILPLLLLLVDLWPLGRLRLPGTDGRALVALLREKLPFFGIAVAVSLLAVLASASGRYGAQEAPPLLDRLGIALATYGVYLERLVRPLDLAVAYPPASLVLPGWQLAAIGLVLALLTAGAVWQVKRRPVLSFGWFWFLIALLPVLGLVPGRFQPAADRYAYLPYLGLFVAIAWLLGEVASRARLRLPVVVLAAVWVVALAGLSWRQTSFWRSSRPLLEHALAVTKKNAFAHANLGLVLKRQGHLAEAASQLEEAARLKGNAEVAYNLANLLAESGDPERAIHYYREAIRLNPGLAEAHNNLGSVLARTGRYTEAILQFRAALAVDPGLARAHYNWAMALLANGLRGEAIDHLREALAISPDYDAAREALKKLTGWDEPQGETSP